MRLSRSQLADVLSLTPHRVSELKSRCVLVEDEGGYDPLENARRYVQYKHIKQTKLFQSGNRPDLEARLRKTIVDRDAALHSLKEMRAMVVDTDSAKAVYETWCSVIAQKMFDMPPKIAQQVASVASMSGVAEAVENCVSELLTWAGKDSMSGVERKLAV
jgi:hypothetical protein